VPGRDRRAERETAWAYITEVGLTHIDTVHATGDTDTQLLDDVRRSTRAVADVATASGTESTADLYRQIRRDVLARQIHELNQFYQAGQLTDATRRQMQHHLDLETERLQDRH
jgi:CPA1 family monovalent cation:H+ antiporter